MMTKIKLKKSLNKLNGIQKKLIIKSLKVKMKNKSKSNLYPRQAWLKIRNVGSIQLQRGSSSTHIFNMMEVQVSTKMPTKQATQTLIPRLLLSSRILRRKVKSNQLIMQERWDNRQRSPKQKRRKPHGTNQDKTPNRDNRLQMHMVVTIDHFFE